MVEYLGAAIIELAGEGYALAHWSGEEPKSIPWTWNGSAYTFDFRGLECRVLMLFQHTHRAQGAMWPICSSMVCVRDGYLTVHPDSDPLEIELCHFPSVE
jgi:hypothetical protein